MKKLFLIISLIFMTIISYGQCSNCNNNYPSGTSTTTSNSFVTVSTCMYGGEYTNFSVTNGETYESRRMWWNKFII